MGIIAGYKIFESLCSDGPIMVCRAISSGGSAPRILKIARGKTGDPQFRQLEHEYDIMTHIFNKGVRSAETVQLIRVEHSLILIMDDIGGEPLECVDAGPDMPVETFISLAVESAKTLQKIHEKAVIHNNLNLSTIFYNRKTSKIMLTDFSAAAFMDKTSSNPSSGIEACNFEFISPERTGRIDIPVDNRSDLYSLGIIFYYLLSGRLPFESPDPAGLIYSHIAVAPKPVHKITGMSDGPLSQIIMRLIEKAPVHRYATANELLGDLLACRKIWNASTMQHPKTSHDRHLPRLKVPGRLYGRDTERKLILDALNLVRTKGTKQIISVSGDPGVGKSALIHRIFRRNFNHEENAAWGKFDQLGQNVTNAAHTTAFQTLIERVLGADPRRYREWQNRLKKALGNNGQLIINMYPDVEKIIGPQPPVAPLSPGAGKNRLEYVLNRFLSVFTGRETPLILFLDDIQWADPASMRIIRSICLEKDISPLLLIVAFREKELPEAHSWHELVCEMTRDKIDRYHIHLEPLDLPQMSEMIHQSLQMPAGSAFQLAEAVFLKTRGNPQFVKELLTLICQEKILKYNLDTGVWEWDLNRIRMARISDTAAGIIKQRIRKLGSETQSLLNSAACLGNRFRIDFLAVGCKKDVALIESLLKPLLNEGILSLHETYPDSMSKATGEHEGRAEGEVYVFSHDMVQDEALRLSDPPTLANKRWQLGSRFLKYFNDDVPGKYQFIVAGLLKDTQIYCRDKKSRLIIASLMNGCGQRALENAAYQTAYDYFLQGLSFIKPNIDGEAVESAWEVDFNLTRSVYEGCVQAAFLLTLFDDLDDFFRSADMHIQDLIQKTLFYELKIRALFARNRMEEAVDMTLFFSGALGVNLHRKPHPVHIIAAYFKTRFLLAQKKDELENLPLMTDPAKLSALKVINSAILSFHSADPDLMALIVLKVIRISLQYGISETGVFAYAGYGLTLCGRFNRIEEGLTFGRLALHLVEKHSFRSVMARTYSTFINFIVHWKDGLKKGRDQLLRCYRIGLETGDRQFACVCAYTYCTSGFFCGEPLHVVSTQLSHLKKDVQNMNQSTVLHAMILLQHLITTLRADSPGPDSAQFDFRGLETELNKIKKSNDHMGVFVFNHFAMVLHFLFNRIDQAVFFADAARKNISVAFGIRGTDNFVFFETMSRILFLRSCPDSLRKTTLKQIRSNIGMFQKWVNTSPEHFSHKFYLLKAMFFEFQNKFKKAAQFFDLAVACSQKNDQVNDRAIIMEAAGRFYLVRNKEDQAEELLKNAYESYLLWGARSKATHMKLKYPGGIFQENTPRIEKMKTERDRNIHQHLARDVVAAHTIDIHTILKASQAISKETDLKALMDKLIRSILENSGASKAGLFIYSDDILKLEVYAEANPMKISISGSTPMDGIHEILPVSIINYVERTDQTLILKNAMQSEKFANDPYLHKVRPVSVLCTPIYNKNMNAGMLYLENNMLQGAFSEARLKILNILISQAVVSIENSMLFQTLNLEKKQKEAAEGEIKVQKRLIENMSSQMVMLEEKERKALADDLHDSASQMLALSLLNLKQLKATLNNAHHNEVETIDRLLNKALDEIRSITFQLSPKVLYEFGLAAAIEWLIDDLNEQTGLDCLFVNRFASDIRLDETVNVVLYRAVREFLINIVKHAQTKSARITLSGGNQLINLTVEDEGKGFLESRQQKGYGIWRIKEKIQALNGEIVISSRTGRGTRVSIRMPLS